MLDTKVRYYNTFIFNVKGFIKIKDNFSLVYVIMTLVIEMKKIVIKENDARL